MVRMEPIGFVTGGLILRKSENQQQRWKGDSLTPLSATTLRSRTRFAMALGENSSQYNAVMIVPTGVGASTGGYAGDALPAARLLSAAVDTLITHPNVLNGALMYWPIPNVMYVEGYALDKFSAGAWLLQKTSPPRSNRIGLVLDRAIESDMRLRHVQVADAARATLGLDVRGYAVTSDSLGVELAMSSDGTSWGTMRNPDSLLECAKKLVKEGCEAIAVVAKFPDDEDEDQLQAYREGQGVDAIAGAEAIISHFVTHELGVPCAHAPALPPLDVSADTSPKAAAEELGYTFLSCVLVGLSNAPNLVRPDKQLSKVASHSLLHSSDVNAVVVPFDACGGSSVLSLAAQGADVIAVRGNKTTLNVTPQSLGIDAIEVENYEEAAGVLLAKKNGIHLRSLRETVPHTPNLGFV